MTRVGNAYAVASMPEPGSPIAGFYTCDNCMWPNAAVGGDVPIHNGVPRTDASLINPKHDSAALRWIPEAARGRAFDDVPQHIAEAADEAFRCRSFDSLRSSVLMARSVVEATCKAKGIDSGRLVTKIDALAKEGHIRSHIKDAAHEIRHLGNSMAHGDFIEPVTPEEADEVLEFMAEILHDVFQSPAKIARRKAEREARRSQPVASAVEA